MAKQDHTVCDFSKDHKGKDYGCTKRHNANNGSACDHKFNAYQHSKTLTDMYEKDHQAKAKELGYLDALFQYTDKA